jgi:L-cysteine/cystine lyase
LLAALEAAPEWRYERIRELVSYCRGRLVDAGYEIVTAPDQAGLISFVARGAADEEAVRLYEAGVVIRDVPDTGWLRVSCGWWTSEEDVERLLSAL